MKSKLALLPLLLSHVAFSQDYREVLTNYHKGFTEANFTMIRNSISDQLNMINGNFSDDPSQWQAHQFLSDSDIENWINMMLENAGPFENSFEIKSHNTRNNSAIVVTNETGQNKFREWKDEEVTYYFGKIENSWKLTGFFIKNLKNPE